MTGSSRHCAPPPVVPCVQSCVSRRICGEHMKPLSLLQSFEQPSPLFRLPSSQSSPASMLPLPQLVLQACVLPLAGAVVPVPRQIGSFVQVFEHPVPSPTKRP